MFPTIFVRIGNEGCDPLRSDRVRAWKTSHLMTTRSKQSAPIWHSSALPLDWVIFALSLCRSLLGRADEMIE